MFRQLLAVCTKRGEYHHNHHISRRTSTLDLVLPQISQEALCLYVYLYKPTGLKQNLHLELLPRVTSWQKHKCWSAHVPRQIFVGGYCSSEPRNANVNVSSWFSLQEIWRQTITGTENYDAPLKYALGSQKWLARLVSSLASLVNPTHLVTIWYEHAIVYY